MGYYGIVVQQSKLRSAFSEDFVALALAMLRWTKLDTIATKKHVLKCAYVDAVVLYCSLITANTVVADLTNEALRVSHTKIDTFPLL